MRKGRPRVMRNRDGLWCVVRTEWFGCSPVGRRDTYVPIKGLSPYASYKEAMRRAEEQAGRR